MKSKNLLFCLVLLLLAIGMVACGNSSDEKTEADSEEKDTQDDAGEAEAEESADAEAEEGDSEIRIAYGAIPPTLDPHMSTATATFDFATQIIEPLFAIDSDYKPQPILAESHEVSDDGKTVTVKLREGILFHNGEEMTADDVVASMERWVDKSVVGSTNLADTKFEAEDDYTVNIILAKPDPFLLNTLSAPQQFAGIMPKDLVENAPEDGVSEYIGTGPFEVAEYVDTQSLHLKKYEDYQPVDSPSDGLAGNREAKVDDIYIDIVTDETIRVSALQTGEYDIATRLPYDNAEQLESDENLKTFAKPFGFQGIWFNKKDGPMGDINMRKAINTALDMEAISLAAYTDEKYFDLSHSIVLEEQKLWYTDAGSDQYNINDPEKAKDLLKEAGYDGEELVFLTTREYPQHYLAAVTIQSQLAEIGINIDLQEYDWATLLDIRQDPETWDILTTGFNFEPFPADAVYLHSKNEGSSGWSENDKIDSLVEEIKSSESLDDASALFEELMTELWDYVPFIPFSRHKPLYAMQKDIEGFDINYSTILWNLERK